MRQATAPSSNSVTASSAGSAITIVFEIACATPRSVVRTESLVLAMFIVVPRRCGAVGASCGARGRGVAFELHALGADGLRQLVEERVPLAIDVERSFLRLQRLQPPIRMLG